MATRTVTFTHRVGGVLTNATSVVLSNAAGTAGVIRNDTSAVVVADSTAMTNSSTGIYSYTFTEPSAALAYTAYVEWVYGGETYRVEKALAAISASAVFGTRAGIEQKVGVANLKTYANLANEEETTEPGLTNIAAAITDDLAEAANEMRMVWREFTDVDLSYSNAMEQRWLADTNEYGAAVKAWNGRNIDRASSEDVPQQIATALDEWTRRLEMLRTGTALLDYQDAEEIVEEDNWPAVDEPVSAVATVDRDGRTISTTGVGPYWDGNLPGYRW